MENNYNYGWNYFFSKNFRISGHDSLFDLRKFQMIHGYPQNQANGKVNTPWKIDMEPENTPLEKEKHLPWPIGFSGSSR